MKCWYESFKYPRWLDRLLFWIAKRVDKAPDYCWGELVMWARGWRPLLWILPWHAHHGDLKSKMCSGEEGYYGCGKCGPTYWEIKGQSDPRQPTEDAMSETMDTVTINGAKYDLVPVVRRSQHKPGEPFNGTTVSWLTYPEYGLEYTGEVKEVEPGMWFTSEKENIGLYYSGAYETKFGLREILRPRTKPALPPPDSEYWTHDVFGIQTVFSWEDEPRSINVMERGSTHGYVWHPNGRSWLDRVLSKGYDWRTLHIAPKGYFDKDEG